MVMLLGRAMLPGVPENSLTRRESSG